MYILGAIAIFATATTATPATTALQQYTQYEWDALYVPDKSVTFKQGTCPTPSNSSVSTTDVFETKAFVSVSDPMAVTPEVTMTVVPETSHQLEPEHRPDQASFFMNMTIVYDWLEFIYALEKTKKEVIGFGTIVFMTLVIAFRSLFYQNKLVPYSIEFEIRGVDYTEFNSFVTETSNMRNMWKKACETKKISEQLTDAVTSFLEEFPNGQITVETFLIYAEKKKLFDSDKNLNYNGNRSGLGCDGRRYSSIYEVCQSISNTWTNLSKTSPHEAAACSLLDYYRMYYDIKNPKFYDDVKKHSPTKVPNLVDYMQCGKNENAYAIFGMFEIAISDSKMEKCAKQCGLTTYIGNGDKESGEGMGLAVKGYYKDEDQTEANVLSKMGEKISRCRAFGIINPITKERFVVVLAHLKSGGKEKDIKKRQEEMVLLCAIQKKGMEQDTKLLAIIADLNAQDTDEHVNMLERFIGSDNTKSPSPQYLKDNKGRTPVKSRILGGGAQPSKHGPAKASKLSVVTYYQVRDDTFKSSPEPCDIAPTIPSDKHRSDHWTVSLLINSGLHDSDSLANTHGPDEDTIDTLIMSANLCKAQVEPELDP